MTITPGRWRMRNGEEVDVWPDPKFPEDGYEGVIDRNLGWWNDFDEDEGYALFWVQCIDALGDITEND
jgi:hypothetical protein